jgi:hypothetical protein
MNTAGNYTSSYAKALLAATRQMDLVKSHKPKKVAGLTVEQMALQLRPEEMPAMTSIPSTTSPVVWVAIDVAKLTHQVLLELPSGKRRVMRVASTKTVQIYMCYQHGFFTHTKSKGLVPGL